MSISVTVDDEPLPAEALGLRTVGQVLAHLQRDDRLVVHVLIDGSEPDLDRMGSLRQSPLEGHTLFIETADPRQMACEVLYEVQQQVAEAEQARTAAAELLRQNQTVRALEKLGTCFRTWQHAQESLQKVSRLLRIDLGVVQTAGRPLRDLLADFAVQLRQIKSSLENRDFVTLSDILLYEMDHTADQWRDALGAVRKAIGN